MSSKLISSNTIPILYGTIYAVCVTVITVIAVNDLINMMQKQKQQQQSIELHIVPSKHNNLVKAHSKNNDNTSDDMKYNDQEIKDKVDKVHSNNNDNEQHIDLSTFRGKIKFLCVSIRNKKSMYLSLLVHIFDTATDIGVILNWYQLAEEEKSMNIEGIDMLGLFYLSIGALLFYRLMSSIIIYSMTRSIKKTILQFLDFELVETILLNWRLKRNKPCDPQIFIQKLEGVFESTPQAIFQLIFIWKLQKERNDLVIMSLIFSLITLSTRFSADDEKLFKPRTAHFSSKRHSDSLYYFYRRIWRVLDITTRIIILCLIWLCGGGYLLTFYFCFEFMILLIISVKLSKFEILLGVVGIIIINDNDKLKTYFPIYRYLSHYLLIALCTVFLSFDICVPFPNCPEFAFRRSLVWESVFGILLYIYIWIATVLSMVLLLIIFKDTESSKTIERDFKSIIISGDSNKFDEMIAFGLKINFNIKAFEQSLFVDGFKE